MLVRHLFAVVALTGAFSLLSAGLLVTLDAVDVAFTEVAVGAGISTVLMLGTLALTRRREARVPVISSRVDNYISDWGNIDIRNARYAKVRRSLTCPD